VLTKITSENAISNKLGQTSICTPSTGEKKNLITGGTTRIEVHACLSLRVDDDSRTSDIDMLSIRNHIPLLVGVSVARRNLDWCQVRAEVARKDVGEQTLLIRGLVVDQILSTT